MCFWLDCGVEARSWSLNTDGWFTIDIWCSRFRQFTVVLSWYLTAPVSTFSPRLLLVIDSLPDPNWSVAINEHNWFKMLNESERAAASVVVLEIGLCLETHKHFLKISVLSWNRLDFIFTLVWERTQDIISRPVETSTMVISLNCLWHCPIYWLTSLLWLDVKLSASTSNSGPDLVSTS